MHHGLFKKFRWHSGNTCVSHPVSFTVGIEILFDLKKDFKLLRQVRSVSFVNVQVNLFSAPEISTNLNSQIFTSIPRRIKRLFFSWKNSLALLWSVREFLAGAVQSSRERNFLPFSLSSQRATLNLDPYYYQGRGSYYLFISSDRFIHSAPQFKYRLSIHSGKTWATTSTGFVQLHTASPHFPPPTPIVAITVLCHRFPSHLLTQTKYVQTAYFHWQRHNCLQCTLTCGPEREREENRCM